MELSPEYPPQRHLSRKVCHRPHISTTWFPFTPRSSPDEIHKLLDDDLAMTTKLLKVNPKVYWIWNHRRWCLEHIPEGPNSADAQAWRLSTWERELFIVEKMLEADSRNCLSPSLTLRIIHDTGLVLAWDYRRYVVASMPTRRPDKAELAYTTKKIEANFSNFSAWHQRTKVLGSLWASGEIDKTSSLHKGVQVFFVLYTPPRSRCRV